MSTRKALISGIAASTALFALYVITVILISGSAFALNQLQQFGGYIAALVIGFGILTGLNVRLRQLHSCAHSKMAVAVSGTTSSVAMLACCSHYAVTLLPALGATGLVAFASEYQIPLFWLGISMNLIGIVYIARKIILSKHI